MRGVLLTLPNSPPVDGVVVVEEGVAKREPPVVPDEVKREGVEDVAAGVEVPKREPVVDIAGVLGVVEGPKREVPVEPELNKRE